MTRAANDNQRGPIVDLTPVGDGRALARALARVLVRRELIRAEAIVNTAPCDNLRPTG